MDPERSSITGRTSLISQTKKLRDYLMSIATDEELKECSDDALLELEDFGRHDHKGMNALLAQRMINRNYRRTPIEFYYDTRLTKEKDLYATEQTLATDSDGKFVEMEFNTHPGDGRGHTKYDIIFQYFDQTPENIFHPCRG